MQGETVPLSNSLPPFQILYDLISARKAHAKIRTVLQSTLFTGYNLQFPTLSKLRKYEFVHQLGYKIFRKVICDINKCMRDLFTIKQKVGKISVSL